jgi:hypothetical protein
VPGKCPGGFFAGEALQSFREIGWHSFRLPFYRLKTRALPISSITPPVSISSIP